MDLNEGGASGLKVAAGIFGDGPIEDERVGVGYEEGKGGFRINHVGGHCGAFAQRDIGWIADEPLDGRQADPGLTVEEVEVMERDMGAEIVGIAGGDVEGAGADVAGMDREGGEFEGNGDGDTGTAGADVEERAPWADGFGGPLDEFLRLGPGDKDVLVYIKPPPGKPAFVEDVLYRAVGQQFAAINIVLPENRIGEGLRGFSQAAYLPLPGQVFHYPIGDQGRFAATV